jgi:hypothetical protein
VLDQVGTCEMLLNTLAWCNILRPTYPNSGASYRLVLGAYGGGIGLNAILPAQAGASHALAFPQKGNRSPRQIGSVTGITRCGQGYAGVSMIPPRDVCLSVGGSYGLDAERKRARVPESNGSGPIATSPENTPRGPAGADFAQSSGRGIRRALG